LSRELLPTFGRPTIAIAGSAGIGPLFAGWRRFANCGNGLGRSQTSNRWNERLDLRDQFRDMYGCDAPDKLIINCPVFVGQAVPLRHDWAPGDPGGGLT
jgi:hypothetical protein